MVVVEVAAVVVYFRIQYHPIKQESFLQLFLLKYSSISSINIAVNILDIVNLVRRIFSGELFIKNAAFVG